MRLSESSLLQADALSKHHGITVSRLIDALIRSASTETRAFKKALGELNKECGSRKSVGTAKRRVTWKSKATGKPQESTVDKAIAEVVSLNLYGDEIRKFMASFGIQLIVE